MAVIQAISIPDWEERSAPKTHIAYHIEIKGPAVSSWSMWRRYSEFDELHTELVKSTGSAPPYPLPPKHKFSLLRSHSDPELLHERKVGLELYLRAIISSKEDKWRDNYAFKVFIGAPVTRRTTANNAQHDGEFTLASWLDEHSEIQARLRDVRADINKREAFSDQGDASASHKSNVSAKQKLAGVLARIGVVGKSLQALAASGLAEGELQRRTDMIARLADDCEKLNKMVSVARQSGRNTGRSPLGDANPTADREALLGPQTVFNRVTRVFGSSEPKETEFTRPLDNQGLLASHQVQIDEQDDRLSQLTAILQRQRHLGEAIGHEIARSIEIIDDIDQQLDKTGAKLASAKAQMNTLG